MKNFLAFLAAAIITFLGIGAYLGWYKIKSQPAGPGTSRLQVDIDQSKIGKDVKSGAEKLKGVIDNNTSDTDTPTDSKASKPVGGINPASPFAPPADADPARDRKKVKAQDVFKDLFADGWFGSDKK